jgi:hypothetical protein
VSRSVRQAGFVAMEAAVWCLLCLPLGLLGISMYALAHDQNIVQMLPESLMRETSGRVMTWRSDGVQGFFDVDQGRLVRIVEDLRDRGAAALQQTSFKLADISARACYWVYDVDPDTGVVGGAPLLSDCRGRGVLGEALSLDAARTNRIQRGVAKPIVSGGEVVEFVSRVVLVGVAVGGRYEGLAEYLRDETVQHGAVWVPREDVVL